jgi:hypothetical protein
MVPGSKRGTPGIDFGAVSRRHWGGYHYNAIEAVHFRCQETDASQALSHSVEVGFADVFDFDLAGGQTCPHSRYEIQLNPDDLALLGKSAGLLTAGLASEGDEANEHSRGAAGLGDVVFHVCIGTSRVIDL